MQLRPVDRATIPVATPGRPSKAESTPGITDSLELGRAQAADKAPPAPPGQLPPPPPSAGFFSRVKAETKRLWKKATETARNVALIAPTFQSLIAARELARVESWITGEKALSAVEWQRSRFPGMYSKNIKRLMAVGSKSTEKSVGLSLNEMLTVDEHFYKMLAPVKGPNGVKQAPDFIRKLAEHPGTPDAPYSAYVYLGDARKRDAEYIMNLWNAPEPPDTNPFLPEDDRNFIWEVLQEKAGKHEMPVFVDMDGDARTFTSTEYLAKETIASMVERGNQLGQGFQEPGLYYRWLCTRLDSFYTRLEPWMEQSNPKQAKEVARMKEKLVPPWLGGSERGLGPWPTPGNTREALAYFQSLAEGIPEGHTSVTRVGNFADAVTSMDQDLLTGVQTYWIKLLREAGAQSRQTLLPALVKSWLELNTGAPNSVAFHVAAPATAPALALLDGPPPRVVERPYDRSLALGETLEHTLNGLGLAERRELLRAMRSGVKSKQAELEGREQRLRAALGDAYPGVNIANLLNCGRDPDPADLAGLEALHAIALDGLPGQPLSADTKAEIGRHFAILDWAANSETRYGDVDFGLLGQAMCFRDQPVGVSEFYQPLDNRGLVSVLGSGPTQSLTLGNARSNDATPTSMVFEGGGGKGFAYVQCIQTLREGLASSPGRFEVDEFAGTSAGAITASLLATGYSVDELGKVMEQLDFKKFNSDAIWLMGGVDPKVRGINRTGLFSLQRMYHDLHKLMAEKLGVEGRPVLFRDLPFKLKVVGTVLNTDLPEDDPLRKLIDKDGRLVMSQETTPNFDVVAAVTASAAVPGFFNSPQIVVARQVEVAPGEFEEKRYRIQLCDGGVVDNLPVSATEAHTDARRLLVLPVNYEVTDPATGKKVGLRTLNFDTANLDVVNKYNQQMYSGFAPYLGEYMHKSQQQGLERMVLSMNLTTTDKQYAPVVVGVNQDQTRQERELAKEARLGLMAEWRSKELLDNTIKPLDMSNRALGHLFDWLIDGEQEDDRLSLAPTAYDYSVGQKEEEDILDVMRAAGAAGLANSYQESYDRRFEKLKPETA